MKKSWLLICLLNFCMAVTIGILLRLAYLIPLDFNYTYLLHAHSHTVILGWCYLAIYSFAMAHFVPEEKQQKPVYNRLFWVTEIAVIGMILTFPFQGYGLLSITFSTLHIFCSYYFCYLIFREKQLDFADFRLLKTGLFFLVFSTLGVWCLGPVAASGAKDSPFYNTTIQYYLHFQFNGWFIFVVMALFFNKIRKLSIVIDQKNFNRFYALMVCSVILTFGLPAGWYYPSVIFSAMNSFGLVFQAIALIYLFKLLLPHYSKIKADLNPIAKILYGFAFSCLILKILLQILTIIPEIATVSHSIRNFSIGFIHLTMLGIVNSFLFAFISETTYFNTQKKSSKVAVLLFLSGFSLMELLLFGQGFLTYIGQAMNQNYLIAILAASVMTAIGLLLFTIHFIQNKK